MQHQEHIDIALLRPLKPRSVTISQTSSRALKACDRSKFVLLHVIVNICHQSSVIGPGRKRETNAMPCETRHSDHGFGGAGAGCHFVYCRVLVLPRTKAKEFQCDHDFRRERGPDTRWRGVAVGCPKSELTR